MSIIKIIESMLERPFVKNILYLFDSPEPLPEYNYQNLLKKI